MRGIAGSYITVTGANGWGGRKTGVSGSMGLGGDELMYDSGETQKGCSRGSP